MPSIEAHLPHFGHYGMQFLSSTVYVSSTSRNGSMPSIEAHLPLLVIAAVVSARINHTVPGSIQQEA